MELQCLPSQTTDIFLFQFLVLGSRDFVGERWVRWHHTSTNLTNLGATNLQTMNMFANLPASSPSWDLFYCVLFAKARFGADYITVDMRGVHFNKVSIYMCSYLKIRNGINKISFKEGTFPTSCFAVRKYVQSAYEMLALNMQTSLTDTSQRQLGVWIPDYRPSLLEIVPIN